MVWYGTWVIFICHGNVHYLGFKPCSHSGILCIYHFTFLSRETLSPKAKHSNYSLRGVNGGIHAFFHQISESANIFVQIRNLRNIQKQKCKSSKVKWPMWMPLLFSQLLTFFGTCFQIKNFWERIIKMENSYHRVAKLWLREILLWVFHSNFWEFSCIFQAQLTQSLWTVYR